MRDAFLIALPKDQGKIFTALGFQHLVHAFQDLVIISAEHTHRLHIGFTVHTFIANRLLSVLNVQLFLTDTLIRIWCRSIYNRTYICIHQNEVVQFNSTEFN